MKRIASILLTSALLLSLCAFGGAASAENPVMTPENGLLFVEPPTADDLASVGSSGEAALVFTDLMETAAFDPSVITPRPWSATMTYPVITRSLPDEDGYVTYTVSYTLHTGIEALVPPDYEEGINMQIAFHDFNVFDLYTGQQITVGRQLSADPVEGSRSEAAQAEFLNELELDGQTISVGMNSNMECVWGEEQFENQILSCPATVDSTKTLYAPAAYDGLVLGINLQEIVREAREEAEVYDEVNYFDESEDLDTWYFFRVCDWAEYAPLQKGSQSEAVKTVQQMLAALGYLETEPDGVYSDNTAGAVKAFQEAAGLDVTGNADNATQAALVAAFTAQQAA